MRISRITAARGKSQFLIPPSIDSTVHPGVGYPGIDSAGYPIRHAARRDQDGFGGVDIDFEHICDHPEKCAD